MLIKSELGPYDPAYMNIRNALETAGIFDVDWFAETNNEDKEHYYDEFIDEFADWLETQDELVTKLNEYRNQPFDVEYYFNEYLNDYDADHTALEAIYDAVDEWVESEESFAESPEYLDSMYKYEAGATDVEFYANPMDIKDNAERLFHEQLYTSEDITHGFKSADDLAEAVNKAIDDGYLEDINQFDTDGYGYHAFCDGEPYFETGCLWLGNNEIEYQMQTSVPYSEKWAPSGVLNSNNVYRSHGVTPRNPDLVYVNPYRMYIYGVMWEHIEEAGRELGLLNGETVNKDEPPVYDGEKPEDIWTTF